MKKSTRKFYLSLAVAGAVILCVVFLPASLEGNWQTSGIVSMDDSHHFLRFESGKILYMSEEHPPPEWIGTYERIGWGEYKIDMFLEVGSGVVRPKVLFLDSSGILGITWRDFIFWKTSRVLRNPAQEWIQDVGTWNIVIRSSDAQTNYYFGGTEVDFSGLERIVTRLNRELLTNGTPLIVYTDSEGIPPAFRDILEKIDVEHEERSNQLLRRTQ